MRNTHQPTPALEIFQCPEEAVPAGERLFGSGLSVALAAARTFPSGAHPQQAHTAHRGWAAEAQAAGAPLWPALLEVGMGKAKSQPSAAAGGAGSSQGGSTKGTDLKVSSGLDECRIQELPQARCRLTIIKSTHQVLKGLLEKQKTVEDGLSPQHRVLKAVCVMNPLWLVGNQSEPPALTHYSGLEQDSELVQHRQKFVLKILGQGYGKDLQIY